MAKPCVMTLPEALKTEISLGRTRNNGLVKGFKQTTQAVERQRANFVLKTQDCDMQIHTIIRAICREYDVPLFTIEGRHRLAAWAGQGKLMTENERSELISNTKCCCVAVCGWDGKSESSKIIIKHFTELFAEEIEAERAQKLEMMERMRRLQSN